MRIINIYKLVFFGCIIISLGSCKKYLDINQNPNAAAQPPIAGLLANVTNGAAMNTYRIADYTSYYTQYLASPGVASTTDVYDDVDASSTWNDYYDIMTDLYDMKMQGYKSGLNAYVGVADILMALHVNMASNVWGNIPYTEAFLGVDNIHPVYDDQKALYDTCIKLLDEGMAALNSRMLMANWSKAAILFMVAT